MKEELKDYLGIPRKLIPWFPIIDDNKCNGCEICVNACKHYVFAIYENKNNAYIENPYHCEVYCQSCQFQCPEEAISFPVKNEVKELFKELRKIYQPK
jgi:NAD-dependent dihydropyrimidine dehydrogenase PreA subunit